MIEYIVCFLIFIPIAGLAAQLGKMLDQKQATESSDRLLISRVSGMDKSGCAVNPISHKFLTQLLDSDTQGVCVVIHTEYVQLLASFDKILQFPECGTSYMMPLIETACVDLPSTPSHHGFSSER